MKIDGILRINRAASVQLRPSDFAGSSNVRQERNVLGLGIGAKSRGDLTMATFEVFTGLKKAEINRIFDMGMLRLIEEGQLLFRKGDIGHEMYVIVTGRIDIIDDYDTTDKTGMTTLAELRSGELLGEMAMFEKSHERSAHAMAREPSQVLVLSEEILEKFLEKKVPRRFLANIIAILCHRLRVTNNMYMIAKYGEDLVT